MAIRTLLALTVLALSVFLSYTAAYASTGDIQLQSLSSKKKSLNKIVNDGKYTLVMIWSTDCAACEEQKPMIQAFHKDYSDANASVVGIAHDGMSLIGEIKKIINKNDPAYPNYVASPETFFSEFEIATGKKFRATPTYIMYNPDGQIMGVAVGQITRDKLDQIVAK